MAKNEHEWETDVNNVMKKIKIKYAFKKIAVQDNHSFH